MFELSPLDANLVAVKHPSQMQLNTTYAATALTAGAPRSYLSADAANHPSGILRKGNYKG